jgi:hypothetical protein
MVPGPSDAFSEAWVYETRPGIKKVVSIGRAGQEEIANITSAWVFDSGYPLKYVKHSPHSA